jgi:hypothetical protein
MKKRPYVKDELADRCKYCINKYEKEWQESLELHNKDFYAGVQKRHEILARMYKEAEKIHHDRQDIEMEMIEFRIDMDCGMPCVYNIIEVGDELLKAMRLHAFLDTLNGPERKSVINYLKKHSKETEYDEQGIDSIEERLHGRPGLKIVSKKSN